MFARGTAQVKTCDYRRIAGKPGRGQVYLDGLSTVSGATGVAGGAIYPFLPIA